MPLTVSWLAPVTTAAVWNSPLTVRLVPALRVIPPAPWTVTLVGPFVVGQ